jgi:SAM-dependent methyltransferase
LSRGLHPLAQSFGGVADVYERGRPEYPPAVAGALAAELGLAPGARVLDLAAGTGKLTRALVAFGLQIVAVEPQRELRERLAAQFGDERALDGAAEAIPLADGSVDAVTVADAFHWFDRPRALAEIRRVLAPDGGLAVLDKAPEWTAAGWGEELVGLLSELRPAHPNFDERPWHEWVSEAEGFSPPWTVHVTAPTPCDPERVIAHAASMSWIAAMPDEERAMTLERVAKIVGGGQTPPTMPLHVEIGLTRLV